MSLISVQISRWMVGELCGLDRLSSSSVVYVRGLFRPATCLLACLLPGKGRKRSLEKGRKEKRRFKCSLVGPELKRAGKLGL